MVKNHLRRLNKLKESKDSSTSQLSIAITLINLAGNSSEGATTNTNTIITATTTSSLSLSISAASNFDVSTSISCIPTSESTIAQTRSPERDNC
jgi:hypothetical protein